MPLCLSRKPKRGESEIQSLPEAVLAVLSFERQHGKISGQLLREPPQCTALQPLWPKQPWGLVFAAGPGWVVYFGKDFQPCEAMKSDCPCLFQLFLSVSLAFQLLITIPSLCSKYLVRLHPFPTFSQNKCDPQLSPERRVDSSLLLCLYSLPLIVPWLPVRQCQGRATS
ncbi:hypothetical protein ILYODFUR_016474 [Ilyodon furcidens]|uniref:Uncharacterized protein n=1 Tax=Ilyodon furcidens TaxID=33524 RepID=A0ABV0U5V2_9TELE